jgi:Zn-dependent protease
MGCDAELHQAIGAQLFRFSNISAGREYCIDVCQGGLHARLAHSEVLLPWDRVEKLVFGQQDCDSLSVGYVRVTGSDGQELAWTDHSLLLKSHSRYWTPEAFSVFSADGAMIPILSLYRGLVLAAIVIERARLVEQADGAFAPPSAVRAGAPESAVGGRRTPDQVLAEQSWLPKRAKQVLLLVAGLAAASWMWGPIVAVALLAYLLIHEYGHVVAMKRCGLAVRGIFILPFMGAVALSEEEAASQWDEFKIAYMGPVFGAVIALGGAVALAVAGDRSTVPRQFALLWAGVSLFNLLPLGVLDGGRIVTSIAYSTHRIVGILASVGTIALCVAAAIALRSCLLGAVAIAALTEMIVRHNQRRLAAAMMALGCEPPAIRRSIQTCWERLGLVVSRGVRKVTKKAQVAKTHVIAFLKPFFAGRPDMAKMTVAQVIKAVGLYLGLAAFFIGALVFALVGGEVLLTGRLQDAVLAREVLTHMQTTLAKDPGFASASVVLKRLKLAHKEGKEYEGTLYA